MSFLVRFSAYRLVKGKAIWEKMEEMKVCKGERSWQSMKEHFRKKIIPQIHTFGLSWRQVRRFRAVYGLDEDHESDVDSEEEEGVDKDGAPEVGGFKPRRTSSPFVDNEVESDVKVPEEQTDAAGNNPEPEPVNNDENLNVSSGEDEVVQDENNVVPSKRRRKLFSTNCSFLSEDESNKDEFDVTPVKKRKIVNEVILEEEEDEELVLELEATEDDKQATEKKDPEKNDQGKEDQGKDNQDKNDQGNEVQGNEVH